MQYKRPVMSMKELQSDCGFPRSYLLRAFQVPGQTFAFRKNPLNRTSPILFDTEEFEKWRISEIRTSQKAQKMRAGVM